MTDLETRLAEAREQFLITPLKRGESTKDTYIAARHGFDAAAAVAREVVAEKDKRIQELECYAVVESKTRKRTFDKMAKLETKIAEARELLCNVDGHDFVEMVHSRRCRKCGLKERND